jgi:putative anti-sigma regulatory factor, serine/threonine protein kinase
MKIVEFVLHKRQEITPCIEYLIERLEESEKIRLRQNDLKLCLYEALSNALIHGNACDETKAVYFCATFLKDRFVAEIRDEGLGCKVKNYQAPSDLLECGRGLYLIELIADRFCYNEENNTWTIEIIW